MCVGGAFLGGGGLEVAVVWVIHGGEFLSLDAEKGVRTRAPLKATGWSKKLCICRGFPCVHQPISFEDNYKKDDNFTSTIEVIFLNLYNLYALRQS